MLPRRADPATRPALADEGPDPEAELRARLLLYRAYRDAGRRLADGALERIGLFRREPSRRPRRGAGRRPTRRRRRRSTRRGSSARSPGWP